MKSYAKIIMSITMAMFLITANTIADAWAEPPDDEIGILYRIEQEREYRYKIQFEEYGGPNAVRSERLDFASLEYTAEINFKKEGLVECRFFDFDLNEIAGAVGIPDNKLKDIQCRFQFSISEKGEIADINTALDIEYVEEFKLNNENKQAIEFLTFNRSARVLELLFVMLPEIEVVPGLAWRILSPREWPFEVARDTPLRFEVLTYVGELTDDEEHSSIKISAINQEIRPSSEELARFGRNTNHKIATRVMHEGSWIFNLDEGIVTSASVVMKSAHRRNRPMRFLTPDGDVEEYYTSYLEHHFSVELIR